MTIGADAYRLRTTALSWTSAENEIIALDLEKSEYLCSNESGKLLWELLATGATFEDLNAALIREYGIDEELARSDVRAFVDELEARSLVTRTA